MFADAGFDDILISFPLVGQAKGERLAALAGRVRIAVVGDSAAVAEGLSASWQATGTTWSSSSSATPASGGLVSRASTRQSPWLRSSRGSTGCASPA